MIIGRILFSTLLLLVYQQVFAVVDTKFDGDTLDPAVFLDIPNGGLASITLDTANDELDVITNGNTDLWTTRNNSPFAWTAAPVVALGQTWIAETEIRYDTDVSASRFRVAGITFYGGPDGSGGSSQGMDFSFGINNWNDRGDPGYQASVEVQGLGDNNPGTGGGNIIDLWTNQSAFLRVEVTEQGAADFYMFFYKLAESDPWIVLGDLNSIVDNSRVSLFFKNAGSTSTEHRAGSFSYFRVGLPESVSVSVPVPGLRNTGLFLLFSIMLGLGVYRLRRKPVRG